jgi:DNA mismatch repair protein MutS2
MRDDLDRGFRDAHARIAEVIRDLQRGGSARAAAEARERLQELEARARRAAARAGLAAAEPAERLEPVDWQRARVGDPVALGGGRTGSLLALPDRRGRVAVRAGGVRLLLPVERVGAPPAGAPARPPAPAAKIAFPGQGAGGGAERCDLRGLRVDEALDELARALDRAAAAGRRELLIVHGLGTGALREAVQSALADSPYAARFRAGAPEEGGEGVTRVEFEGPG